MAVQTEDLSAAQRVVDMFKSVGPWDLVDGGGDKADTPLAHEDACLSHA